jgi:hypothetical protein
MATLRDNWSNKILHLSSFINRKKNDLIPANGWKAFVVVLSIIGAEILLLIISLPSYLATRDVSAFESEGQTKQYHLRRALTLGTIATLLVIWVIKLLLILFLVWQTNTYGTVKINETYTQNAVLDTAAHDMLVAGVDKTLSPPTIETVRSGHGKVTLTGTAPALDAVIVLFSEVGTRSHLPPKIYTAWADTSGKFSLVEDSSIFNLPPGEYNVSAITYDQIHKTKSANSTTFSFSVNRSLPERFVHSFDILLNILALIAIIIGLFVTILVS